MKQKVHLQTKMPRHTIKALFIEENLQTARKSHMIHIYRLFHDNMKTNKTPITADKESKHNSLEKVKQS